MSTFVEEGQYRQIQEQLKEIARLKEENERFKIMYKGFENQALRIMDDAKKIEALESQLADVTKDAEKMAKAVLSDCKLYQHTHSDYICMRKACIEARARVQK